MRKILAIAVVLLLAVSGTAFAKGNCQESPNQQQKSQFTGPQGGSPTPEDPANGLGWGGAESGDDDPNLWGGPPNR